VSDAVQWSGGNANASIDNGKRFLPHGCFTSTSRKPADRATPLPVKYWL